MVSIRDFVFFALYIFCSFSYESKTSIFHLFFVLLGFCERCIFVMVWIKIIECCLHMLFCCFIYYFLNVLWVWDYFLAIFQMLKNNNCKVNSSLFPSVACFIFVHSKMNLLDFANLPKEFLNECLINWSKEMAQVNWSIHWDIYQLLWISLFELLVIIQNRFFSVHWDFQNLILFRHF